MASVINTNIAATRTHNVYNRNNEFMNAAMTRVATGMKINSAKDGASTWAISEKMRERMRANDQANQNVQNDIALLKTAQGGVGNTLDILKTLKERAINAANDSNMNTDRTAIAAEVQQLIEQIDDNANKVKFNGRVLLAGNAATDKTATLPASPTSASESTAAGGIVAATAAKNPETTASHAVYSLAVDGTKTFKDLGFAKDDIITFSWKEGSATTATTATFTVADETAAVSTLAATSTNMKIGYLAKDAALASNDTQTADQAVKSGGTAQTASANGIYAVGNKGMAIKDFTVSVTNAAADETNTVAQKAMAFTGKLQGSNEGTHAVVSFAKEGGVTFQKANGTAGVAFASSDDLSALTTDGVTNAEKVNIVANDVIKLTVGSTTAEFTYTGSSGGSTMQDMIDKWNTDLASAGISVKYLTSTTALTNGTTAVKDAGGDAVSSSDAGFYIVGKEGTELKSTDVKFEILTSGTVDATKTDNLAKSATLNQVQSAYVPSTEDSSDSTTGSGSTLTFHIGGESDFGLDVTIGTMTASNLGVSGLGSSMLDKDLAKTAIDTIDKAIQKVLTEQTNLGSVESRLGYASDNLVTMNENLEAADSAMRDSDIAKEMTSYMKYAVLSQASQYMLAQAGQNAFQVLNLLQQ